MWGSWPLAAVSPAAGPSPARVMPLEDLPWRAMAAAARRRRNDRRRRPGRGGAGRPSAAGTGAATPPPPRRPPPPPDPPPDSPPDPLPAETAAEQAVEPGPPRGCSPPHNHDGTAGPAVDLDGRPDPAGALARRDPPSAATPRARAVARRPPLPVSVVRPPAGPAGAVLRAVSALGIPHVAAPALAGLLLWIALILHARAGTAGAVADGLIIPGRIPVYALAQTLGLVALGFAWWSTAAGLLAGARPLWPGQPVTEVLQRHQRSSAATVTVLTILHALALIIARRGDSVAAALVPQQLDLRAVGILACYLAVLITATSLLERRLDATRWQQLHRGIGLVYLLAVWHAVGIGSDLAPGSLGWVLVWMAQPTLIYLVARRWITPRSARDTAPAQSSTTPSATAPSATAPPAPDRATGRPGLAARRRTRRPVTAPTTVAPAGHLEHPRALHPSTLSPPAFQRRLDAAGRTTTLALPEAARTPAPVPATPHPSPDRQPDPPAEPTPGPPPRTAATTDASTATYRRRLDAAMDIPATPHGAEPR